MALGLEILLGLFGGGQTSDSDEADGVVIGTEADLSNRIRSLQPPWYGGDVDQQPVQEATIGGASWALSFIYDLVAFVRQQARVATATGGWLELAANDYIGPAFRRILGERDSSYSLRIRREVLRHRNTRRAVVEVVQDLTGSTPEVYRPTRAADCGGWGGPGLALGRVGRYGSRAAPYEAFVITPYPQGHGIPNRGGWGSGTGGYGSGNFSFVDDSETTGSGPTVADILAAIESVRAVASTIYVQFSGLDGNPPVSAARSN